MNTAASSRFGWNLHKLVHTRDLVFELVRRDLKAQYKSSMLGVAWSMLNPILQLLVFTFLFRVVLPLGVPNYAAFAFTGLLAWSWFQLSMIQATGAITSQRSLIRRPGFPCAVLPAASVAGNLFNLLMALPILMIVILFSSGSIPATALMLPLLMLLQFVMTLSLAYLLAAANAFFRDIQHMIAVVLQLTFYFTPVFYPASRVPEKYQHLYQLNPMVHIVEGYRDVLLHGRMPDFGALGILAVVSVGMLAVGYRVFVSVSHRFAEEL